jgi:hypothetical protein
MDDQHMKNVGYYSKTWKIDGGKGIIMENVHDAT